MPIVWPINEIHAISVIQNLPVFKFKSKLFLNGHQKPELNPRHVLWRSDRIWFPSFCEGIWWWEPCPLARCSRSQSCPGSSPSTIFRRLKRLTFLSRDIARAIFPKFLLLVFRGSPLQKQKIDVTKWGVKSLLVVKRNHELLCLIWNSLVV